MSAPVEKLWFSTVVDAVFIKGLGTRLTPQLKAEIKKVGIDLDKLQPAYPVDLVHKTCKLLTPVLFPRMTEEEAFHELGVSSMRGYTETLLGKALIQILKLIGVRRSLLRMHTSMRSGNNYIETFATVIAANCVELRFSDVSGMPSFYQGIIEEGGRMAHAKNLHVTTVESTPPGHTFRVEWDE
ncbi:MAG: DUF2378 family protein [Archangium sp.]|nr:DUF2378 family protein [Archangium sp.]